MLDERIRKATANGADYWYPVFAIHFHFEDFIYSQRLKDRNVFIPRNAFDIQQANLSPRKCLIGTDTPSTDINPTRDPSKQTNFAIFSPLTIDKEDRRVSVFISRTNASCGRTRSRHDERIKSVIRRS